MFWKNCRAGGIAPADQAGSLSSQSRRNSPKLPLSLRGSQTRGNPSPLRCGAPPSPAGAGKRTDCRKVNCPEGAREATLGCVASLLAMTAVIGGWSFFWNTSYNAKWTSAQKRKSIFDSNHPEGIPQLAQWANFILRQQNITFPKGNASLSRQGKHHLAQRKSFSLCHSGWSLLFYCCFQIFASSQSIISCLPSSVMGNSRFSSISLSS